MTPEKATPSIATGEATRHRRSRRLLIALGGLLLLLLYVESLHRETTAQQVSIIQPATFPTDI